MTEFYEACAMCGPKDIKSSDIAGLLMALDRELALLASQGTYTFKVIPSPGFNFYAALSILNLKRILPEIELEVLVGDFNNKLKHEDIEVKDFIISHADIVSKVQLPVRQTALDSLCNALLKNCSYMISFSPTDAGFCAHVREHAAFAGLDTIYTDRINAGVSV
ncbi:MAG: hypothetical protein IJD67_05630 [Clostridia bacterium]|nr:hypothetical protein [Clostridia bacterium]